MVFLLIAASDNLLHSSSTVGGFFSSLMVGVSATVDVSGVLPFVFFGFVSDGTSGFPVVPFETAFFVPDVFGGFASTTSLAGTVVDGAFLVVFFFEGRLGELEGSETGGAIGASTEAKKTPCASAFYKGKHSSAWGTQKQGARVLDAP
jgi:hypothetical protein